jgi:hypothetical protein
MIAIFFVFGAELPVRLVSTIETQDGNDGGQVSTQLLLSKRDFCMNCYHFEMYDRLYDLVFYQNFLHYYSAALLSKLLDALDRKAKERHPKTPCRCSDNFRLQI